MIFDTHAHYDDETFDPDREELLASLPSQGVSLVMNSCANPEHFSRTVELMEKYDYIYGAVGVHPDHADQMSEQVLEEIRRLSRHPKALAIGEIGLDYYWHKEPQEHALQKKWFRAQMELAREERKPFLVHSREAAQDTLELVREMDAAHMYGGIIHCFSYSLEIAREYLNMGLFLGIGGVVTFKNGRKLKEVVSYAPLEQLVLETDAPYLAPVPYRGKRNHSGYLSGVAETIAELKGISPEEVLEVTASNARRLLLP